MKAADTFSLSMLEKGIIKEEDIPIYRYGIENGIILIFNMLTAFVIGILTGRLVEILVFLLSYITLRSYSGGFHLDNKIACYISSNLILMIPACASEMGYAFVRTWNEPVKVIEIAFVICSAVIIFSLSPMDSKQRKLDTAEKKHFKFRARLILMVQLVVVGILCFIGQRICVVPICISICTIAVLMLIGKIQLAAQLA